MNRISRQPCPHVELLRWVMTDAVVMAWRREANQAMFLSMRESFVPGPHHASTVFGGSGAVAPSKAQLAAANHSASAGHLRRAMPLEGGGGWWTRECQG